MRACVSVEEVSGELGRLRANWQHWARCRLSTERIVPEKVRKVPGKVMRVGKHGAVASCNADAGTLKSYALLQSVNQSRPCQEKWPPGAINFTFNNAQRMGVRGLKDAVIQDLDSDSLDGFPRGRIACLWMQRPMRAWFNVDASPREEPSSPTVKWDLRVRECESCGFLGCPMHWGQDSAVHPRGGDRVAIECMLQLVGSSCFNWSKKTCQDEDCFRES